MEYDPQQPHILPLPPPRKHNTSINIIVTFLSLILMILIFFGVIAYYTPSHYPRTRTTPTGALNFDETSPENYTGSMVSLSKAVVLRDIAMGITDDSNGHQDSLKRIYNHATVEVEGGVRCTFEDTNSNDQLDTEDRFYLWNAGSGDILRLVYTETGGVIAQYTFE
jgi:hypothetical protein